MSTPMEMLAGQLSDLQSERGRELNSTRAPAQRLIYLRFRYSVTFE